MPADPANRALAAAPSDSVSPGESTASPFEGVSVELTPAPHLWRFLALCVDLGIVSTTLFASFMILMFGFGAFGTVFAAALKHHRAGSAVAAGAMVGMLVVWLLVVGGLTDAFFIYFEHRNGATPGKKLFGLRVVSLRGGRLTLGQCCLREIFRYLDVFLIFPGPICILLSSRHQRLGDLVAATLVVYSEQKAETGAFLYLSQSDYYSLLETLQPPPVDPVDCKRYLAFAYHALILRQPAPEEVSAGWEARVREFLTPSSSRELDRQTCLLFFAQYCYETIRSPHPKRGGAHE